MQVLHLFQFYYFYFFYSLLIFFLFISLYHFGLSHTQLPQPKLSLKKLSRIILSKVKFHLKTIAQGISGLDYDGFTMAPFFFKKEKKVPIHYSKDFLLLRLCAVCITILEDPNSLKHTGAKGAYYILIPNKSKESKQKT